MKHPIFYMIRIMVLFCALLFHNEVKAQWAYAVPITITNTVNSVVNNYQVPIYINTSTPITNGQMLSNGNDIRFASTCLGGTFYDYYIDSGFNSTRTKIWVKIDNLQPLANKVIYLLHGNPSAAAASTLSTFNGPYSSTNQVNVTNTNTVSNCQRGFRFSPNHLIIIPQFGKKTPDATTRYVTIFDFASTALLHQLQVAGASGVYSYANLASPVWLQKNTQYLLELYNGSGDMYYYGSSTQINNNLTYYDMRYCNSCTQNTFPTTTLTSIHYGVPDFMFYTCDTNNIASAPTYVVGAGSGAGPTITLGQNPTVCATTTTAALPYTAVNGAPTTYSIVWSAAAITAGFVNVTSAAFPATSPISIAVPGAAAVNSYSGTLTLSNACGTSVGYPFTVTITNTIPITTQPANTSICSGGNASFTVAGTGATGYQWQVNTGSGFTNVTNTGVYSGATTSNLSITAAPLTMNGYTYRCVLSSTGCGSVTSASGILTVGLSNSTITITNTSSVSCTGVSITFNSSVTNAGTAPIYQWQVNGLNVGTNSPTYTSTTLVNGDVVRCLLTPTGGGCTGSVTSNSITMSLIPSVAPTITVSTTNTTVCAGTSVIFVANYTNGGTTPSFQWRKNGVPVGSGTNSYTDNGVTTGTIISCVMTSNAPCAIPTTVTSNNVTMTVNPILIPSVSISTSSTTRCDGQSTVFTATPVNGGTSPMYQWFVNNNPVGTNSTSYTTTTLQNGDIVTCNMNSSVACPSSTTVTSNALTMTINPTVIPSISISSDFGTQACVGVPVTFTATTTNGGPAPLFQWRQNSVSVGTNSPTYTTTLTAGSTINCILTSTSTCAIPTTVTSNTLTMTVNPVGKATVDVVPTPDSIMCTPGNGILFYTVYTNGGSNNKYQWLLNGIDIPGATQPTFFSNTLANNDLVSCRFSSSNVCVFPELSQPVTIKRYPVVVPGVTIKVEDLGGNTIRFTANIVNGGPNPMYHWRKNGNYIPNETNSVYTVTGLSNTDRISVEIKSDAICASPKSVISNDAVFTTNVQIVAAGENHIGLYPNPVMDGQLFLTTDKTLKGNTEIRITDRLGSLVSVQKNIILNDSKPVTIEVGNLAAGMYILQVINDAENVNTNIRFNKQ